jgi:hypothetical protein
VTALDDFQPVKEHDPARLAGHRGEGEGQGRGGEQLRGLARSRKAVRPLPGTSAP